MNRLVRNSLLGTAATVALVAGACVPAFATSPTPSPTHAPRTVASIQAAATTQTSKRIASLHAAVTKITAAKDISAADRATILATFNSDLAGMASVESKVLSDTTVASAAADYATTFTTYRVYAVAIPQGYLANAADRMTSTAIPKLTAAHTKLSAALAGADAAKSTPALLADLADMSAKITAASSSLNGVAAASLAITPAAFDANKTALASVRASVKSAVADLKQAESDAKTVLAAIR